MKEERHLLYSFSMERRMLLGNLKDMSVPFPENCRWETKTFKVVVRTWTLVLLRGEYLSLLTILGKNLLPQNPLKAYHSRELPSWWSAGAQECWPLGHMARPVCSLLRRVSSLGGPDKLTTSGRKLPAEQLHTCTGRQISSGH